MNQQNKGSQESEIVDLRLRKAMGRLEKAIEQTLARVQAAEPEEGTDMALISVLEQRITVLQSRIGELEAENDKLKKQLNKSGHFFETVKQVSNKPQKHAQSASAGRSSDPTLASLKSLFDED